MVRNKVTGKRLFVLDTNVLMHDPAALFRFQEHDIFLPMMVLEELDNNKRGPSEVARNARQASRFMEELMRGGLEQGMEAGLKLPTSVNASFESGRLFFQTQILSHDLPPSLPGNKPDNTILETVLALQDKHTDATVILVSKDINLRIKAAALGIPAEDYQNDQVLDDLTLLYKGQVEIEPEFWDRHSKELTSWKEEGRTFYRISGPDIAQWYPNQLVHDGAQNGFEGIVRSIEHDTATVEICINYRSAHHAVWGINARNREQNFALNLLMDPAIDFVSLLGNAGTGKTLLTLAAGLAQVLDERRYQEIIMTRATVPMGEDIGFLPGTEEEKMVPWMGALMDNLEVLASADGGEWGRAATNDLLRHRIKIHSLNFMRGRTFLKKYVIIDEAQNLTSKQMKSLITRAGPGTKIVCMGNVAQIDTPYLTETTSGITYVVDRFKDWAHGGHITLKSGERSRLADHAAEIL
ncbi:MAG: PhoH family protein [Gammaproteobacteria bacterium]|nr:PhoH family protein [Gammaproteobacteria bacterium]